MSRIIVFVTGCPGSGKTYFANRIKERFPFLVLSSYDELKEVYFDKYGFDSLEERAELNKRSLAEYYTILEGMMGKGTPILTEYPFNKLVHEDKLNELVAKYGYKAVTITLYGDPQVLLARGTKRDKNIGKRNPGHLLTRYHKDSWNEKDRIPVMTIPEFIDTLNKKNYFMNVGTTVKIDVTDFSKIDYDLVYETIEENL